MTLRGAGSSGEENKSESAIKREKDMFQMQDCEKEGCAESDLHRPQAQAETGIGSNHICREL